MKRRYKVLSTAIAVTNTEWMVSGDLDALDQEMVKMGYEKIDPVFQRDGWYYDRKIKRCWMEYKGLAWMEPATEQFLWELKQLDTKHLTSTEVAAIKTLTVYGTCPMELKELLWRHNDNEAVRQIHHDMRRLLIREAYDTVNGHLFHSS